jgi:hypothetical protein
VKEDYNYKERGEKKAEGRKIIIIRKRKEGRKRIIIRKRERGREKENYN